MAPACIMIVDDHESVRFLLAEAFREEGYTVQTASNGQQALTAVERAAVDVLLTDLDMPVMDGRALARALKERDIRIPLVIMTAAATSKTLAQDVGAVAYLHKPFDLDTVLSTVDGIIHVRRRPLSRDARLAVQYHAE